MPTMVDSKEGRNLIHVCVKSRTGIFLEEVVEKYKQTAVAYYEKHENMIEFNAKMKAKHDIKDWVNQKTKC